MTPLPATLPSLASARRHRPSTKDGARVSADVRARAYDIKTDAADEKIRAGKWADYKAADADGAPTLAEALAETGAVFSLVTADQAHMAARNAAKAIRKGAFFFDCNSCSPGTKQKSAALIEGAGGRYVDAAVMLPVHPRLHRTPLLVSGPHAEAALSLLQDLDMAATLVEGKVGAASAIKMTRSIVVKGLEALAVECVLAGRKAGIDDVVLDSLEETYPGFGWKERAAYMLERVMTHGVRRAAEMREVARTVSEWDLEPAMSSATVHWQQQVGDLHLKAAEIGPDDYGALADAILAGLDRK